MKQLAWAVLAGCLKQTRSKTEPRTRTRLSGAGSLSLQDECFSAYDRNATRDPTWLPRRPATLAGPMQDKR